jgi:hypothetical protein
MFYTREELEVLSVLTGIAFEQLRDPQPNVEAVRMLRQRLDWFFSDFLVRPDLTRERDGKTGAELLVKALQKTINKCAIQDRFDLQTEFDQRRRAR